MLMAMAQKSLRISSPNGDQKILSVVDTTTFREILLQCQEDDNQDRKATLLQGVTLLEPRMTVSEAGLEDGDDIYLVWPELTYVEIAGCRGMDMYVLHGRRAENMDQALYVRTPMHVTRIANDAFARCKSLVKIVIRDSVTSIGDGAFDGCSSLRRVGIPLSMISVRGRAFASCSSLSHVNENPQLRDQHWSGCLC